MDECSRTRTRNPKTAAERTDDTQGRDWTVADKNYKHTRLYRVDAATGKSDLVTRTDVTVYDFDFSPDSQQLVIGAATTPTIDDSFMGVRLYIVPAAGGTPEPFVKTEGKLQFPRWSPDGRSIAWLGATTVDDPFAGTVFVAPVRRTGGAPDRTNVTPDYEGSGLWLGWQPGQPDTLTFVSAERQDVRFYTMAAASRTKQAIATAGLVPVGAPSFSTDGKRVAFVANAPGHPNEVFAGDLTAPRRVTTLNPQLAGIQLGAQEVVTWKAKDGWVIEGVLVKPVGFRAGVRYPLVLQPHGGPEAADPNGWNGSYSRWGQMLAGAGYLTLYPNYRGSIGRGVTFAKADHRDLMGKEFQDMLDGIDHLVAQGLADPNRVGIGGGSYGGYTSAWATTYASDRFKAAIPWMGISNWISMTGTSDIFLENSTVHWNLVMYDNYEKYLGTFAAEVHRPRQDANADHSRRRGSARAARPVTRALHRTQMERRAGRVRDLSARGSRGRRACAPGRLHEARLRVFREVPQIGAECWVLGWLGAENGHRAGALSVRRRPG